MNQSLNLLSERSRKRNQVRWFVRVWTRILIVTVVLTSAVGLVQWRASRAAHARQVSVEAEYEPIRQLKIENARLKEQIAELEKAEIIPLKLAVNQPILALVGLTNRAVRSQQHRVYLQQLEIERAPVSLDPLEQSRLTVVFEGHTADKTSVEQLADSLRQSGSFAKVELSTQKLTTNDTQEQLSFSIQCSNKQTIE